MKALGQQAKKAGFFYHKMKQFDFLLTPGTLLKAVILNSIFPYPIQLKFIRNEILNYEFRGLHVIPFF
jgi:hypothetical protein